MTDTTTTAAVTAADGLQQAVTQAPVSGTDKLLAL